MARHTEPAVNNSLGTLLQGMLPRSHVRSENTQAIVGHSGLRPDILITAPGRSPVVIEAEYLPAATAEVEAKERLGLDVAEDGRRIEAVIALRYPIDMGDADDLRAALTESRISWCVFTEESAGVTRFPESGWLDGSVGDLADLVRLVSVPQRAVDEAARMPSSADNTNRYERPIPPSNSVHRTVAIILNSYPVISAVGGATIGAEPGRAEPVRWFRRS